MSDHDHLDGDPSRWCCNYSANGTRLSDQWVLESDEYRGIAIIELPWESSTPKEQFQVEQKRCQAAADLIQSSPFMLQALLKAQQGDNSMVDEAIARATGELDWLGKPMSKTNAQCRWSPEK